MRASRLARELDRIKRNPPWGISCSFVKENSLDVEATLMGPRDSPYENGAFRLLIEISEKYPFEPPQVKFTTPVYHPNIDKGGRICMDLLKMPPQGDWKPTVTLENVLLAIQTLLSNPNPDDPLMLDIANQYKYDRDAFIAAATEATKKHAL